MSQERVGGFVASLPGGRRVAARLTRSELAHGVIVSDAIRVDPSSGPADRAGGSSGGSLVLWLLPLALLLSLPALLARR